MGKNRRLSTNRQEQRPAKPKYTTRANMFHQQVVAPLEKRFRQALKARRYAEAESLYRKITEARKEHRLWIDRSEKVRIR
jgi:Tfp pilus assembly protein PilF